MIFSQVKESQRSTGSPTLHMRLPSLCIQALSLRDSTVGANRAGGLSTSRLWLKTSPQERTASPVNRKLLLGLLNHISVISIIQGAAWAAKPRSPLCRAQSSVVRPRIPLHGIRATSLQGGCFDGIWLENGVNRESPGRCSVERALARLAEEFYCA